MQVLKATDTSFSDILDGKRILFLKEMELNKALWVLLTYTCAETRDIVKQSESGLTSVYFIVMLRLE